MQLMKKNIFLFLLIMLFGCDQASELVNGKEVRYENASADVVKESIVTATHAFDKPTNDLDRKIIWFANLVFQVKNVDESTTQINELTKKHNGFVSNMNLNSSPYRIKNRIEIRISSNQFDALIKDIKEESIYMKNIEINSQDVTEEFVDIESRLKTKRQVRERYIDILRKKTGDVKDIIAAEEAIRNITEEIEVKEGRLRYLKDKVNFSTIVIELFQEVEYTKEPSAYIKPYTGKLVDGFNHGWSIITNIMLWMINIWPFIFILIFVIWKRKWFGSRSRNK